MVRKSYTPEKIIQKLREAEDFYLNSYVFSTKSVTGKVKIVFVWCSPGKACGNPGCGTGTPRVIIG